MTAVSTTAQIGARRLPLATIAVCAVAAAVSLSRHLAPEVWDWISVHLIADAFAVYRGAYWLMATTPFVHFILPHLAINLVTMAIYGSVLERQFSRVLLLSVFFTGAIVSMIALLQDSGRLIGTGLPFGISGGVCAVFGFLCVAHKPMLHPASWRQWILSLFYPAILIWLFVVEVRGITPTGTIPHAVGLVVGGLIGWAVVSRTTIARAAPIAVSAIALGSLAWSPWQPAWLAAQGQVPHFALDAIEAAPPRNGERPKARALFFVNSGSGPKLAAWVDDQGVEHGYLFTARVAGYPVHRTARDAWSLPTTTFETFPHGISERWVVRDADGALIARLDLSGNPHRALIVDLGR